jgi:AraC family transcriptional regulator, regulatory protein of adaptative response / methylated-DNA-[protein]-cysteine methyltransferase
MDTLAAISHRDDDARWAAVLARRPVRDFVYAVASTGIYCRPACPARRPQRAQVAFFDSPAAARAAGFRACRRCAPDGPDPRGALRAAIAAACRAIERAATPPSLDALARRAGLSRWRFLRAFRAEVGVTPKAYSDAVRAQRLRSALPRARDVTGALLEAGYGSLGRAYAHAAPALGMPPARFRAGGAGETLRHAVVPCTLGSVLIGASARGICAVQLGDDPATLAAAFQARFAHATHLPPDADFEALVQRVVALVDGAPGAAADLPLDIRGTAFQHRVWAALRALPPGTTATYAELAARAVGNACAANELAVIVPCHRAVPAAGGVGRYRWGKERKRKLLAREPEPPSRA